MQWKDHYNYGIQQPEGKKCPRLTEGVYGTYLVIFLLLVHYLRLFLLFIYNKTVLLNSFI